MYEDDDDEIEEIRELMYDLLKDFPTGATSKLLEEQYEKRYVQTGIGRPLPANWLHFVQQADEFEVKQLSTVTMLYLVSAESLAGLNPSMASSSVITPSLTPTADEANDDEDSLSKSIFERDGSSLLLEAEAERSISATTAADARPLTDNDESQENSAPAAEYSVEPMTLLSMPSNIAVQAHVVFATDPDNIFIRLCSWDPVPDYLYSALQRVSDTEHGPPPAASIRIGQILAAPIHGAWERVRVVRKSAKFPSYWLVLAVDVGFYHIVAHADLRPPSDAVRAFSKIFLAKIKLSGINPVENASVIPLKNSPKTLTAAKNEPVKWQREAQKLVAADLTASSNDGGGGTKKVELLPEGEWAFDAELKIPVAAARLRIDGVDFAERLIAAGFATKKGE